MTSPAPQSENHSCPSCHRGDSPNTMPSTSTLTRGKLPPRPSSASHLLMVLGTHRAFQSRVQPSLGLRRCYDFEGAVADQTLVEGAFAGLAREQASTDAALAAYPDLGARVGKDHIAIRELWVHRVEEYARHCGHADLLRECIDGRVGQ
ncbi:MAG: DUF664 domain-containing protein [Mycobacteriales bacterium]